MAKQQVTVPDIGGAEGAEVVELLVAVGDQIVVDQSLIVLESDKASMEIPSTVAGTLVELLVSEGEQLAEGAPVAMIEVAADGTTATRDVAAVDEEPAPATVESVPPATPAESPAVLEADTDNTVSTAVKVPDIGTDEAVELIELCVKVGDVISEGDSLVVLESDKASMEVPAPQGGEVLEIMAAEGDSVKLGDPLLLMRVSAGSGTTAAAAAPDPIEAAIPLTPAVEAAVPVTAEAAPKPSGGVYAGPAVRKLAREFGIELGA